MTKLFEHSDYGKTIGYMEEIRSDLAFLEKRLRKPKARILICIDDLDRCEPEKSVEMLQAINLLLNFDSFIVFMGIDARIITRSVEYHYKDLLGPSGASGYEYLDKIIQVPFRIPKPSTEEIKLFIERQLNVSPLVLQDATKSANSTISKDFPDVKISSKGAHVSNLSDISGSNVKHAEPSRKVDINPGLDQKVADLSAPDPALSSFAQAELQAADRAGRD